MNPWHSLKHFPKTSWVISPPVPHSAISFTCISSRSFSHSLPKMNIIPISTKLTCFPGLTSHLGYRNESAAELCVACGAALRFWGLNHLNPTQLGIFSHIVTGFPFPCSVSYLPSCCCSHFPLLNKTHGRILYYLLLSTECKTIGAF